MNWHNMNLLLIKFLGGLFLSITLASILIAQDGLRYISIEEALHTALTKNPIIESVRAQREAMEAKTWLVKSDFLPQILISSGYTRYNEPNIIVPIHQAGVFPPLDDDVFQTVTQVKLSLFSGGRTVAATRAAQASVAESVAQEEMTEQHLIESIAQIYIRSKELQDKKSLLIAHLNLLRQRDREMRLLLSEGRISSADLALVTASIESARSDSLELALGFYQLGISLGQLLGTDSPILPLMPEQNDLLPEVSLQASLTAVSQITGPKVRQALAQLERAQALQAQATRSFWPEISGFASYFLRSGGDLDMVGEWAVGLTVSLPIFDGGKRIANVRATKASVKAAEQGRQSALQAQSALLKIALEQWRIIQIRQQHLIQAVATKSQSVTAQRQMYEAGRISLSELLTQETELLRLKMDEREVIYAGRQAVLNYHATAGTLTAELAQTIVRSVS